MTEVGKLWRLQQLDLTRKKLQQQLEQSAEQTAYEETQTAAKHILRQLKENEKALGELQKQVRLGELELADLEAHIKEAEAALYGGAIANPRELASIEKKLALMRTKRDKQEESLLNSMQDMETLQSLVNEQRQEAETKTGQYKSARTELAARTSQLQQELAGTVQQRQSVAATVEPTWLSRYEKLGQQRPDVIATVEGAVCGACRLTLPQGLINQAAAGARPTYCEGCGRLLYMP